MSYHTLVPGRTPTTLLGKEHASDRGEKFWCVKCRFRVRRDGHADRCGKQISQPRGEKSRRKLTRHGAFLRSVGCAFPEEHERLDREDVEISKRSVASLPYCHRCRADEIDEDCEEFEFQAVGALGAATSVVNTSVQPVQARAIEHPPFSWKRKEKSMKRKHPRVFGRRHWGQPGSWLLEPRAHHLVRERFVALFSEGRTGRRRLLVLLDISDLIAAGVDVSTVPGYCYRKVVTQDLGPYPTFSEAISAWLDENPDAEGIDEVEEYLSGCQHADMPTSGYAGFDFRVGSAMDLVEESKRVNGPEIAKLHALESFNDDIKSMPKTVYRMPTSDIKRLSRYLGFQVMSQQKVFARNDHTFLEVSRNLCRDELERRHPHNQDFGTALHIGATTAEVKRWWGHEGHDFSFAMREDKDVARVFEDVVKLVGNKLNGMRIPSLRSKKGNATKLELENIDEALGVYEKGGRKRIFHPGRQYEKGKHNMLFFQDSLYNMSEAEFGQYWLDTGATVGYATMFVPDALLHEFAPPSDLYKYQEYYVPVEQVETLIAQLWPSILLLSPLLPLPAIAETFHHIIRWCFSHGWKVFKHWLESIAHGPFPLEACFGIAFDLMKLVPIWEHIMSMLKPLLRHYLARVRVTWKGGHQNGYDHRVGTWEGWAKKRRFAVGDFFVDSEVVTTFGEMWVIRYWKSTGTSPITYSLELPLERTAVLVADLESAFLPGTLGKIVGLDGLRYFPVLAKDWFTLLNWAMAEPFESLDFAVMMTTLNRIRGGLSLSSNVLVESMQINDNQVTAIALACLMEVGRRQNIVSAIEDDETYRTAYQTNVVHLLKVLGTAALSTITMGAIVPLWTLCKWLLTTHPTMAFVKYPMPVDAITVPAEKPGKKGPKNAFDILKKPIHIVAPHKEDKARRKCLICQLAKEGAFSEDGMPEHGQEFICTKANVPNDHKLGFTGPEMVEVIRLIQDSETEHRGLGAGVLAEVIRELKHWAEANTGGVEVRGKIHHITGGPGTGKTEVIKALMAYYESVGVSTGVMFPFRDLRDDYVETKVVGHGTKAFTFDAMTTWWAAKWENKQVIIVDECTGLPWKVIRAMACHAGAKEIILVGDRRQTKLNSAAGEGIDPTNPESGINWVDVPEHELVWNFRLDAWRTKMLNAVFGYQMRCKRTDELPPKFLTKAEYDAMKENGDGAEREFVFAHAAAQQIFGKESVAGDRNQDNLSVRSAQGKTIKGVSAVSASALDNGVYGVHGMLCVAVSRSKKQVYFVVADTPALADVVPRTIADKLKFDTRENIRAIAEKQWPEKPEEVSDFELSPEEGRMERFIKEKANLGKVVVLADEEEEDQVLTVSKARARNLEITMSCFSELTENDFKLMVFFREQFHFCLPDALFEVDATTETKDKVIKFLGKVYDDDTLMGRSGKGLFSQARTWFAAGKRLQLVDGKRYLDSNLWFKFVEEEITPVVVYVNNELEYVSPSVRLGTARGVKVFNVGKNHCTVFTPPTTRVVVEGLEELQDMPEHSLATAGLLVAEIAKGQTLAGKKIGTEHYVVRGKKKFPKVPLVAEPADDEMVQVAGTGAISAGGMGGKRALKTLPVAGRPPQRKPTFARVQKDFGLSKAQMNFALEHEPISSSWKENVMEERETIHRKTKLRLGKDCFRFARLIDPSGAWNRSNMLNEVGPVAGYNANTNVEVNWDGFIHQRTKAGVVRKVRLRQYRAIAPGVGNHFGNTPVESLLASQRIGKRQKKPELSSEAVTFARQIARATYDDFWYPAYVRNREEINRRVEEAIRVAKSRNYHGRAAAEDKKGFTKKLICSNKDQFKPIKSGKLNLLKSGQVLLQSPAKTNFEFMAWMRIQGYLFKTLMKPDVFTDDYETAANFRKRITQSIRELPESVMVAIVDGEEWDSQQNSVTVEIEKELCRLFGATDRSIEEYFVIRGNLPFIMYGVFRGTTNGEKGSGFLDTKLGNTKLQAVMSHTIVKGVGPKVVGIKGDDYLHMQTGITIDEHARTKIRKLCGMRLNVEVGQGGEFCGNSVSRAGMYPSITRQAMKAVASKADSYEKFTAHQQAWRDSIEEYQDCGLQETVVFSAMAEGKDANYVQACLEFLNSMGHISRKQWEQVTKPFRNTLFHLNSARGPVLI